MKVSMLFLALLTVSGSALAQSAPPPLTPIEFLDSTSTATTAAPRSARTTVAPKPQAGAARSTASRGGGGGTTTTQIGGITFESIESQSPVIVTLTKRDSCSSNICYYYDASGNHRLSVYTSSSAQYEIKNSRGSVISKINLATEERTKLLRNLGSVSESCPATVAISRQTLRIVSASNPCGPKPGPNSLVIVSKDSCSSNICYLYDDLGKHVMSFYTAQSVYKIEEASAAYPTISISSAEYEMMGTYVRTMSKSCPLRVTFDGETGRVSRMKLQCDPLAFLETGIGQG